MIAEIVAATVWVLTIVIIARSLLSWFPNINPRNPIVEFIVSVTDPILAPIRRIMPRTGMFDFTPLIALLLVQAIGRVLIGITA